MTAPSCSDCAYVRTAVSMYTASINGQFCGVKRISRPLCVDERSPDAPCGPDAKLFAKREGK